MIIRPTPLTLSLSVTPDLFTTDPTLTPGTHRVTLISVTIPDLDDLSTLAGAWALTLSVSPLGVRECPTCFISCELSLEPPTSFRATWYAEWRCPKCGMYLDPMPEPSDEATYIAMEIRKQSGS